MLFVSREYWAVWWQRQSIQRLSGANFTNDTLEEQYHGFLEMGLSPELITEDNNDKNFGNLLILLIIAIWST